MTEAKTAARPRPTPGARRSGWDWVAVTALAGLTAGWRLGAGGLSPSELLSLQSASSSLGHLVDRVGLLERAPAAYFGLAHEWNYRLHAHAAWQIRLLSALAGVALVLLIWRLGGLVGGRMVGLLAAALAALSPLVITLEGLARPNVLAMLAVTAAVWCALEARRRDSTNWLALCAVCAVAAVSVHYSAWLVVLPLIGWVAVAPGFSRTARVTFAGVVLWYGSLWLTVAVRQLEHEPASWHAHATWLEAFRVLGAPFGGRGTGGWNPARLTAVAAVWGGLAALVLRTTIDRAVRSLVAIAAGAPMLVILAVGLSGPNLLAARNVAVGAPFVFVALAAAIVGARRPAALALLALVAVSAGWGLIAML